MRRGARPASIFDFGLKIWQQKWARKHPESYNAASNLMESLEDQLLDRLLDLRHKPKALGISGAVGYRLLNNLPKIIGHNEIYLLSDILNDKPQSNFDCITSFLRAHWVDDPTGFIQKIPQTYDKIIEYFKKLGLRLRSPGPSLISGVTVGPGTIDIVRDAIAYAENRILGGIFPRVIPLFDVERVSHSLLNAGFYDIVLDTEMVQLKYPNLKHILKDIQLLGESNAILNRRHYLRKDVLLEAENFCKNIFKLNDIDVSATFIYFIGWKS